jgi:branched-chain amino acid transport system substrate-binding protein
VVDYVVGYGISVQKDPYIADFKTSSWDKIYELEKAWKKKQGYA